MIFCSKTMSLGKLYMVGKDELMDVIQPLVLSLIESGIAILYLQLSQTRNSI